MKGKKSTARPAKRGFNGPRGKDDVEEPPQKRSKRSEVDYLFSKIDAILCAPKESMGFRRWLGAAVLLRLYLDSIQSALRHQANLLRDSGRHWLAYSMPHQITALECT